MSQAWLATTSVRQSTLLRDYISRVDWPLVFLKNLESFNPQWKTYLHVIVHLDDILLSGKDDIDHLRSPLKVLWTPQRRCLLRCPKEKKKDASSLSFDTQTRVLLSHDVKHPLSPKESCFEVKNLYGIKTTLIEGGGARGEGRFSKYSVYETMWRWNCPNTFDGDCS